MLAVAAVRVWKVVYVGQENGSWQLRAVETSGQRLRERCVAAKAELCDTGRKAVLALEGNRQRTTARPSPDELGCHFNRDL